jgi:hypothetical protein
MHLLHVIDMARPMLDMNVMIMASAGMNMLLLDALQADVHA